MCGIAGWLGHVQDGSTVAARVAARLRHRGPDGQCLRHWFDATLIHTRLSILDLSPAGTQPMANEDGSVFVVFNGEIYNHREIRRELERNGHVFRGRSDTEVLPHLYEDAGAEGIARLRGMFALAIYDLRKHRLLLARDRFGIKPLFYAQSGDRLTFASELTALREVPDIDLTPNQQAIYDYAALSYIPAPETFYRGIHALMPGELLEARLDQSNLFVSRRLYTQWSVAPNPSLTLTDAADRAGSLVDGAVRGQMESDVPLGALLSGGIDSSLISMAAGRATNHPLQTFNARFSEAEYDETWAALAVADQIGSRHHTFDVSSSEATWAETTNLLTHAGQPFADTSVFAVNALCRHMRRFVTVALSGDGGDEAFGGYNCYWYLPRIAQLQRLPPMIAAAAARWAAPAARWGLVRPSWPQRLKDLQTCDDAAVMQTISCWLRDAELKQLCPNWKVLPVRRLFEQQWAYHLPPHATRSDRLTALATEVNLRLVLPNAYLFKVDVASMKESLEVRVPMLDEDVVAFGLTLPRHLQVKGKTCKLVLREIAARRLPATVATKAKKGFDIPVDGWVDSDFRSCLRASLLDSRSPLRDVFNRATYEPWVRAFCERRSHPGMTRQNLYTRIVMLMSLHLALAPSNN